MSSSDFSILPSGNTPSTYPAASARIAARVAAKSRPVRSTGITPIPLNTQHSGLYTKYSPAIIQRISRGLYAWSTIGSMQLVWLHTSIAGPRAGNFSG